ncbi:MAG TPA: VacJ family lipoprotein [Steroidobacteraceae bacterium]|nr:VacJ family lipoprotein [Steroidobacteraceae bacterium]
MQLKRPPTALRHGVLVAAMLVLFAGIAGCASLPRGSVRDPRDHVERFNRTMFKLNTTLDHAVLRPVARGYVRAVPAVLRTGIANFLSNLGYTKTIGNDVLQARPRDFARDVARLAVNTTLGLGGLLDPATRLGLASHDRDFGQTLGKWGIRTGSYLVLPFLGPSDVRDAIGTVPDRFMTVDGYLHDAPSSVGLFSLRTLDKRAAALPSDATVESAYDPYAFVRSAWFQLRDYKVHEGRKNYLPELPPLDPGTGK